LASCFHFYSLFAAGLLTQELNASKEAAFVRVNINLIDFAIALFQNFLKVAVVCNKTPLIETETSSVLV